MSEEKHFGSIYDLPLLDTSASAPGIEKRIIYGPKTGWEDYVMRYFKMPPHTAFAIHSNAAPHMMYTLSGDGVVYVEEEKDKWVPYEMKTGYWTKVPGDLSHEYKNDSDEPLEFFCIVPTHGDPHAKKFSMRAERAKQKEEKSE